MKTKYKEIAKELLEVVHNSAWSIENMEAHGAAGRNVTYIGSNVKGYLNNDSKNGKRIFDYYRDTAGDYWYKNRVLLPSGEIVSVEMSLFGRKVRTRYKK